MSPAGSYPAGPGRALSVSCLGLVEPCSDTPPDPYLLFNHSDTRLIPGDTPVTEKRRPNLLPRVSSRHITDLRHTMSFGSKGGYEAPVNSYLTGASPILSGLRSRTGAGELSRSSRFAKHTLIQGGDLPCSVFRASRLHSAAAPLRRSRNWPSRLAQRALCPIARSGRCDVRWSPPSSSDGETRCVTTSPHPRSGFPAPPADRRHEHRELSRSSLFAQRLAASFWDASR